SVEAPRLCRDCRELDLPRAFAEADEFFDANWDLVLGLRQRNSPSFTGLQVATLGTRIVPDEKAACQLCRFLWDVRAGDAADDGYHLRSFPSFWALPFIKLSSGAIRSNHRRAPSSVLAVVPAHLSDQGEIRARLLGHGSVIFRAPASVTNPRFVTARPIAPIADLGLVSDWIAFCAKNHGPGCLETKGGRGKRSKTVAGFRLLDCATRLVVEASVRQRFVALSYVWGAPGGTADAAALLRWPKVVEDAIAVTEALGLRYLWVDRYCIDQDNAKEKHQQISNMHIIYQQAQLTIVAAAGSDSNYGLPGVSRLRETLPSVSVSGLDLLAVPQDAYKSIRESTWWERGWTYQEGVLSRRRVVFTEHQIYFECGAMVGYECFQLPPSAFHSPSLLNQERFIRGGLLSGFSGVESRGASSFRQTTSAHKDVRDVAASHIRNYSHRKLSYNTDVFNAIQGILTSLQIHTVLGIILPSSPAGLFPGSSTPPAETRRDLCAGLVSWWHESPHAIRIPEFPSWSWVGWRGNV
ncbi:heterokaryon incompatibility protein-domain-containing protein, partial [Lasiosphaeria ovina]